MELRTILMLLVCLITCAVAGCWQSNCESKKPAEGISKPRGPVNPTVRVTLDPDQGIYRLRGIIGDKRTAPRELAFEAETTWKEVYLGSTRFPARLATPMRELFEGIEGQSQSSKSQVPDPRIEFGGDAEDPAERAHPFFGIGQLPGSDTPRDLQIVAPPSTPYQYIDYSALAASYLDADHATLTVGDMAPVEFALVRRFPDAGTCFEEARSAQEQSACWRLIEKGMDGRRLVWLSVQLEGIHVYINVLPEQAPVPPGAGPMPASGSRILATMIPVSDAPRAQRLTEQIVTGLEDESGEKDVGSSGRSARIEELRGLYPWKEAADYLGRFDSFLSERQPAVGFPIFVSAHPHVPAGVFAGVRSVICAPVENGDSDAGGSPKCGWNMIEGPILGAHSM